MIQVRKQDALKNQTLRPYDCTYTIDYDNYTA